ncbi:MAG: trimeric intracellular cation channel family protein [Eggerthellaceae bacterium]
MFEPVARSHGSPTCLGAYAKEKGVRIDPLSFSIPFWVELLATSTGAIAGTMHAVKHDYDFFGVMCMACINGLAGGIVRDVVLGCPVYCMVHWELIVACMALAVPVMLFCHTLSRFDLPMDVIDAFSISLWAIVGAGKAYDLGFSLLPCAIMGMVTSVGGGCLRDILLVRLPRIFISGTLYSSAVFIGAFLYIALVMLGVNGTLAAIVGIVSILAMRLVSVFLHIETRPARDYSDKVEEATRRFAARAGKATKRFTKRFFAHLHEGR